MDQDKILNTGPEPGAQGLGAGSGLGQFVIEIFSSGISLGYLKDEGGTEYWVTVGSLADAIRRTEVQYGGSKYLQKSSNNYYPGK
jgi:hypothetical protein